MVLKDAAASQAHVCHYVQITLLHACNKLVYKRTVHFLESWKLMVAEVGQHWTPQKKFLATRLVWTCQTKSCLNIYLRVVLLGHDTAYETAQLIQGLISTHIILIMRMFVCIFLKLWKVIIDKSFCLKNGNWERWSLVIK